MCVLKTPCLFINDTVYHVINYCNFHVAYLIMMNKFKATRLLRKLWYLYFLWMPKITKDFLVKVDRFFGTPCIITTNVYIWCLLTLSIRTCNKVTYSDTVLLVELCTYKIIHIYKMQKFICSKQLWFHLHKAATRIWLINFCNEKKSD